MRSLALAVPLHAPFSTGRVLPHSEDHHARTMHRNPSRGIHFIAAEQGGRLTASCTYRGKGDGDVPRVHPGREPRSIGREGRRQRRWTLHASGCLPGPGEPTTVRTSHDPTCWSMSGRGHALVRCPRREQRRPGVRTHREISRRHRHAPAYVAAQPEEPCGRHRSASGLDIRRIIARVDLPQKQ